MATTGPTPPTPTGRTDAVAASAAMPSLSTHLAQYGLKEADGFPEALVVPEGKSLTLSAPASGEKRVGYVMLAPKTIDEVKRWIGVPDNVGKRRTFPVNTKSDLAMVDSQSTFAALSKSQRVSLRTLAYQYVQGDLTQLAHLSQSISQILANATIGGLYLLKDIDVMPNSELKLAANLKVLFANNIRIWKGGTIRILGHIKMDCASIIGEYTAPAKPIVMQSSLALGVLENLGG